MTSVTTKLEGLQPETETAAHLFDNWFDPIESGIRERVRGFIEELIRGELDEVLARPRYGRRPKTGDDAASEAGAPGHRHGSRRRSLTGTFGKVEITVPRARLQAENGTTTERKSQALRAYQRRTLAADAVIAGAYLAGTNTRRVRRALGALFGGAVGKDTVSRVWRKVKSDWEAWNARSLAEEPIVRLILDGWCGCGSTARRRRSRCGGSLACARMGRRCCWPSRAWAGRAPKPGAPSLTISSPAGCGARTSSSSTARPGSRAR